MPTFPVQVVDHVDVGGLGSYPNAPVTIGATLYMCIRKVDSPTFPLEMYKSADAGATWSLVGTGPNTADQNTLNQLSYCSDGTRIFVVSLIESVIPAGFAYQISVFDSGVDDWTSTTATDLDSPTVIVGTNFGNPLQSIYRASDNTLVIVNAMGIAPPNIVGTRSMFSLFDLGASTWLPWTDIGTPSAVTNIIALGVVLATGTDIIIVYQIVPNPEAANADLAYQVLSGSTLSAETIITTLVYDPSQVPYYSAVSAVSDPGSDLIAIVVLPGPFGDGTLKLLQAPLSTLVFVQSDVIPNAGFNVSNPNYGSFGVLIIAGDITIFTSYVAADFASSNMDTGTFSSGFTWVPIFPPGTFLNGVTTLVNAAPSNATIAFALSYGYDSFTSYTDLSGFVPPASPLPSHVPIGIPGFGSSGQSFGSWCGGSVTLPEAKLNDCSPQRLKDQDCKGRTVTTIKAPLMKCGKKESH